MTSSVARAFSIRTNWSERAGVEPPSSSWTGRSTFELPSQYTFDILLIPDLRKSSGNVRKIFLGRSPAGIHTGEAAAHPYRAEEGSRQSTVRNPRPQRRGFRAAGF